MKNILISVLLTSIFNGLAIGQDIACVISFDPNDTIVHPFGLNNILIGVVGREDTLSTYSFEGYTFEYKANDEWIELSNFHFQSTVHESPIYVTSDTLILTGFFDAYPEVLNDTSSILMDSISFYLRVKVHVLHNSSYQFFNSNELIIHHPGLNHDELASLNIIRNNCESNSSIKYLTSKCYETRLRHLPFLTQIHERYPNTVLGQYALASIAFNKCREFDENNGDDAALYRELVSYLNIMKNSTIYNIRNELVNMLELCVSEKFR